MKRIKGRIKLAFVAVFAVIGLLLAADNGKVTPRATAFSDGAAVLYRTPGRTDLHGCYFGPETGGTFTITPPASYVPGQTYQVLVRHINSENTAFRWGFQLTALAERNGRQLRPSGGGLTQVVGGVGRDYIEHTVAGHFRDESGGAEWAFNWTAPARMSWSCYVLRSRESSEQ